MLARDACAPSTATSHRCCPVPLCIIQARLVPTGGRGTGRPRHVPGGGGEEGGGAPQDEGGGGRGGEGGEGGMGEKRMREKEEGLYG